jgi:hypothetical protein
MNEERYMLEWRGAKKSGYSYADIEAGLAAGDLHSLYKINVDGRWIVLRDFLEKHRALPVTPHAGSLNYSPPEAQAAPWPTQAASAMQPPPLPLGAAISPAPDLPSSAAQKPAWFWPAIIISSTVCILLVIVVAYVVATTRSSSQRIATASKPDHKPRHEKLQPFSFTGKEIFPSALISTATVDWNGNEQSAEDKKTDEDAQIGKRELPIYGEENSWLGIDLGGLEKGARVSVEITTDGFMKPSKWQGTVNTMSQDGFVRIKPKLTWDYDALMKVRQQRPINVSFSASIDGTALPDVNETYTLRSINDCPLYISRGKDGSDVTSLSFLFAAYVNENHPQVQDILKEALGCHIVDNFDGYQSKEPKQVMRQVFSVWNALQRRGIKYSNVPYTPPGDRVFSQSVRFMDQSINSHQANCVDGSVLMASVLQKIGIKSHLVLVPGHCFLAFDLTPDSTALPTGLETTMLGNNEVTEVKKMDLLPMQDQKKEHQDSLKTFIEAVSIGNQNIQKYARELLGQGDARYKLVSIEDARDLGIMPIPFTMDK